MNKSLFIALTFVAIISFVIGNLVGDKFFSEAVAHDNPYNSQIIKPFTECFSASMWVYSGRSINNGENPTKTVKVPLGWSVVGGGSSSGEPVVIMCK